ncbi:MAG: disulfide isomerase DsbC N-terminal domain-containing protein [Candidatus Muiribacteriota bacterium]
MYFYKKQFLICLFFFFFLYSFCFAEFIPPENIIEKSRFPVEQLNLVKTKSGVNYLISEDGRYVFQGELFDVWNGRKVTSVPEMDQLKNRVDFNFLGINPEKMFTLKIGTGDKKAYVFAEPNCYYCHKLAKEADELLKVNNEFSIYFIIVPVSSEKSIEKTKKLFEIAQDDKNKALDCFINDSFEDLTNKPEEKLNYDSIDYNRLVVKALSIEKFPFVVNPEGIISVGMPEDIFFFLKQK